MALTRAVLVTDVVDSVLVSVRLGDDRAVELWRAHHRMARDLTRAWNGREIDSSDGFLLLFDEPTKALAFARAYHQALTTLTPPLQARAGLHVGPFETRDNDAADVTLGAKAVEVEGLAKVLAARTMSIACGGQTLMTAAARDALAAPSLRIESRGHWRIKGIDEPIELFEAVDGAPHSEPPAETSKAYRVVRNGEFWLPLRDVRHSLPAERDTFVGRAIAIRELRYRFESGARLVSLLGPGGVGKTRLAQRFGWSMLGDFPGGVWFCDLSQAHTTDGMYFAVAQGLDVTLGSADPVAQLGDALVGRDECLVVLDNFEQLVEQAEATVGRWLERAPKVRFLVTSRESLGVSGEAVMRLATLDDTEASELFARRASAASGKAHAAPSDAAALARLVQLLDGLPLAIELAAARAASMPLATLLRRIDERFALLVSKGGRRTRQATLRAAFDWSWDLLSPAEKTAFAQLSVIEGSCSLEAAEAIVDLEEAGGATTSLDVMRSLVDKSLVRHRDDGRYDMLVSLREYANEQFALLGSADRDLRAAARLRHCRWFALLGAAQAVAGRGIELDNLVAACVHAASIGEVELAMDALEGAWVVLDRRGPFRVAIELADKVLDLPGLDNRGRGRVELVRGFALRSAGDSAAANAALSKGLELAHQAGDSRTERQCLAQLGYLHLTSGRVDQARAVLEEALRLAEKERDLEVECITLGHLGNLAQNVGDMDEAFRHYEKALEVARRSSDRRREGGALGNLGLVLHYQGKTMEARERYEQALALARDVGDRQWEGNTLCNLGLLLHEQGAMTDARVALQSSLAVASELGYDRLAAVVHCNLGIVFEATEQSVDAATQFEHAVTIARKLADRRSEGQFLGYLGLARAREARFEDATLCFGLGERLLAEVSDRSDGAALLCQWAQAECLAKDVDAARERLRQAQALAATTSASDQSHLAASLRDAASAIAALAEAASRAA